MYILGVDTSAIQSSVALLSGREIILENRFGEAQRPSRHLLPIINNTLEQSGVPLDKIDIFATARGPGSFTGLRIGLGSLMGLADALKKPIYGFDSHFCMAKAMGDWGERLFAPTTKARAGYFYSALFRFDNGPKRLTEDAELTPHNLAKVITAPAIMTGEGLTGNEAIITKSVTHNVEFIISTNSSAAVGAAMLANDIAKTDSEADYPPISKYVGRSQAEINLVTNRSSTLKKGGDDGR